MIVLHAAWLTEIECLALWAEDSNLPQHAQGLRGRRPKVARPRPHPFACDEGTLTRVLVAGSVLDLDEAATGQCSELCVLLPSESDGPTSSPQLLRDEFVEPGEVLGLAPWIATALELPAAFAADLLLDLPAMPPAGVAYGDDLVSLREVGRLSLETVVRGRVLPLLSRTGEAWSARWQPLSTSAAEGDRRTALVESLPGAVRCAGARARMEELLDASVAGSWDTLDLPAASAVVEGAWAALTDALVRDALWNLNFLPSRGGPRTPAETATRAWLQALIAETPEVAADDAPLAALSRSLDAWYEGVAQTEADAFRACFRLSPPGDEVDAWRLDFLLQARDDPSLLVPAEQVWEGDGSALTVLGSRLGDPQEHLLGELGRAMRLMPGIERALHTARPEGVDLGTDEAWQFLRESAPLMERAGFGVQVPPWWNEPAARLGLRLRVEDSDTSGSSGLLGLDGLCECRLSLALGDESLTAEELEQLARLKVPLVQVRGRWVEILPDDLEQARAIFEDRDSARLSVGELLRYSAGVDRPFEDFPVLEVEADGALGKLLSGEDVRPRAARAPAGFVGELRPYQKRGLAWLRFLDELGLGSCLADDMGLGKTIQVLALLLAERAPSRIRRGTAPGPTLLVCPMSVVGNWKHETERFAPGLGIHVHHGAGRPTGAAFHAAIEAVDLVITTYALATRDQQLLSSVDWHRIALDEAQNIKNTQTRQTRAIRSLRTPRRVALTGTPIENRLSELWSIMQFLNPGLLGSQKSFRKTFATPIERYRDEERAGTLRRLCGPFMLRRLKTDRAIIRDLPDKQEMKVLCHLTREQATLYQAVLDDVMEGIASSEGIQRRGLVLSALTRLKQVCNHPAQLLKDRSSFEGRSGKLMRLEEILEEVLASGDRALVFTQYTALGEMLRPHLQRKLGREVAYLHGGTPRKARDAMVERFQGEDGPPVFLLSLKAGGTGLNLTAANHVVHFDRWWNPAVEQQATDRAFRIGQRRDVQVRKLVCVGTLEERIDRMIDDKKDLAERVLGAGEAWLTELSTADLRDVFALSADAVSEE